MNLKCNTPQGPKTYSITGCRGFHLIGKCKDETRAISIGQAIDRKAFSRLWLQFNPRGMRGYRWADTGELVIKEKPPKLSKPPRLSIFSRVLSRGRSIARLARGLGERILRFFRKMPDKRK